VVNIWAIPLNKPGSYMVKAKDSEGVQGYFTLYGRNDATSTMLVCSRRDEQQCPFKKDLCYTIELLSDPQTSNLMESRKYVANIKNESFFNSPFLKRLHTTNEEVVVSSDDGQITIKTNLNKEIFPSVSDKNVRKCYNILTIENGLLKCTNSVTKKTFYVITQNEKLIEEMVIKYTFNKNVAFIIETGKFFSVNIEKQNTTYDIVSTLDLDQFTNGGSIKIVSLLSINLSNVNGDDIHSSSATSSIDSFRNYCLNATRVLTSESVKFILVIAKKRIKDGKETFDHISAELEPLLQITEENKLTKKRISGIGQVINLHSNIENVMNCDKFTMFNQLFKKQDDSPCLFTYIKGTAILEAVAALNVLDSIALSHGD